MYTEHDCTNEDVYSENLTGRYVILKPEFFKAEYRDEKYQLVLCSGGFGCDPTKSGNAIFVKEINDNPESYRIERYNRDILGFAKDSVIAAHKEKYL
ncbi:MAG: hypothetical protein IJZ79_02900 [Bacilli bacterium]|nr:hypothetical protein [Bacilli bacterium]MBQ8218674.1 hypothetical protein [Bacilli bacterium]